MTWNMVLVIVNHADEGADLFDCFQFSDLDNCQVSTNPRNLASIAQKDNLLPLTCKLFSFNCCNISSNLFK
jgi:hypothetical protein